MVDFVFVIFFVLMFYKKSIEIEYYGGGEFEWVGY